MDKSPSYLSGKTTDINYYLQNYCLAFVDLLGQKDAVDGHSLLPTFETEAEKVAFTEEVKRSVGAIARLQKRSRQLLQPLLESPSKSSFREKLSIEQRGKWDKSQTIYVGEQRWSDGLVYFSGLSRPEMVYPINAVLSIFMTVGSLAFLGLASRSPIRGAIDLAWGVELQPGEIYGPVVARAATLESKVAGLPRIVIGDTVLPYLQSYIDHPETDDYSEINRHLAMVCKDMILLDTDGVLILHYLSGGFKEHVTQQHHDDLYNDSIAFVDAQIAEHQSSGCQKLLLRYKHLKGYFERYK